MAIQSGPLDGELTRGAAFKVVDTEREAVDEILAIMLWSMIVRASLLIETFGGFAR